MKKRSVCLKHLNAFWHIVPFIFIIITSCTTPSIIATREQQQGDYFNNMNQYDEAILHYEKYLEASKQLGIYRNLDMEADVYRKVAQAYNTRGNFTKATEYIEMALSLDSIQNNPLEIIEDYRTLGKIYLYVGNYRKGIGFLTKALELNEGMESSMKAINRISIADTYLSLGQAFNALGHFQETEQYIENALKIYLEQNDWQGKMEAQFLLGNTQLQRGETNKAVMYLQNSLELAQTHDVNGARQLQSIGESYEAKGEYEQALNSKLASLQEAEKSNIIPLIFWSRIGVGDAYNQIGDLERATDYYFQSAQLKEEETFQAQALGASLNMRLGDVQQAQQYFAGTDALIATGLASLRLGEARYKLGEVDSSMSSYQDAADYFTRAKNSEGAAKAYLRTGHIQVDLNNLEAARINLNLAADLADQEETEWEISYQKGRLFEKEDQIDLAIKEYQEAIRIIENIRGKFTIDEFKSTYVNDKIDVYDRLINLLLNIDRKPDAFAYAQRARSRAFLDLIGNKKIDAKASVDPQLVENEQALRFQIHQLTRALMKHDLKTTGKDALRGEAKIQLETELNNVRAEYSDLLTQLRLKNRDYQSMVVVEPSELESIQLILDENTALIEYWVSEEKLVIWVITRDNLHTVITDIPASHIRQSVVMCRRLLLPGAGDAYIGRLKNLYQNLLSPIELLISQYENLGIIPHGELHFLPFQALINNNDQYLIEKFNIFYIPSISVYEQCLKKREIVNNQFLAMALGNIALGEFSALPGTTKEVRDISRHFPEGTTLFELETTESYLKNYSDQYQILHLATHGLLNSLQPMYSYLLFAPTETDDGQLTVHEVFGLDLNARLVTLSACQTGLGDISNGDELIGLSRAFLYAGTPAVIVSLWSVADDPTALLMTRFYEHMKQNSLQEALTLAQRDVLKQYKNPFFWAPFQLIGNGGD